MLHHCYNIAMNMWYDFDIYIPNCIIMYEKFYINLKHINIEKNLLNISLWLNYPALIHIITLE